MITVLVVLLKMMMSNIKRYFSLSSFLSLEDTEHKISRPVSQADTANETTFDYARKVEQKCAKFSEWCTWFKLQRIGAKRLNNLCFVHYTSLCTQ
jgi:hypothetical protein